MDIVGFLRTILLLVAFYYIFKFIGRVVIPFFLAKGLNRMANQQQRQQNFAQQKKREEGKVTIKATSKSEKKTSSDMGEYVDFEEVK